MNDWLDYQGSGSSRAYSNTIEHASWVPTGTPQFDADHRLITAYAEKMKKLKSEYKSLKSDYNKYMTLYNYNKDMAESQESNRSEAAKSGQVLRATQFFEKNVWRYKKDASDAKNEAVSCLTKMKANVDSQKKLQEDVKSIDDSDYRYSLERSSMVKRKANSLFIPDELPSNIKQSYFDMPADEFIEHAAKERVRFRDSINDTIGKVMDKVTDADHKAFDARSKQREAEERLEKAQVERVSKEIRDAADKLYRDAADVRRESFDYRDKLDNAWDLLVAKMKRTTDPKALAQLDSAYRNLSNDVIRTNDKLKTELSALYHELYKIQDRYNDFVYYYPTGYVNSVPRVLQDSKKYLDEADKINNTFITYSNRKIWK